MIRDLSTLQQTKLLHMNNSALFRLITILIHANSYGQATSRDILSHDQLSQAESLTSQDEESIDLSEVTPGLTDVSNACL